MKALKELSANPVDEDRRWQLEFSEMMKRENMCSDVSDFFFK